MKKFICGLVLGCLISSAFSYTREGLYKKFGPKLIEAVVLVIKDEINILRVKNGLAERTDANLRDALTTKYDSLSDYSWMNDD